MAPAGTPFSRRPGRRPFAGEPAALSPPPSTAPADEVARAAPAPRPATQSDAELRDRIAARRQELLSRDVQARRWEDSLQGSSD
jgi:hypothetical protein